MGDEPCGGGVERGAIRVIELGVVGSLQTVGQHGQLAPGDPKQRALLAVLLLHRGERVSPERLIDWMWREQPRGECEQERPWLRVDRRRVPGDRWLALAAGRSGPDRLSAGSSRCLRKVGARSRAVIPGAPLPGLREALRLWRGAPWADFAYEPFAQVEIVRLEKPRLVAVEERLQWPGQLMSLASSWVVGTSRCSTLLLAEGRADG